MSKIFRPLLAVALLLCLMQVHVHAAGELPDGPENKKWTVDGNTATIVVDSASDIPMLISKADVSGRDIQITSDAKYISVTSASLPKTHIVMTVAGNDPKPDNGEGTTSTVKFVAGASPSLAFNGKVVSTKDSIQWSTIARSADTTVTLEVINGTFAKVTFVAPVAAPAGGHAAVAPPTTRPIPMAQAELMHAISPVKVQAAVTKFSDSVYKKCTACNGTGKVQVQVQTGTKSGHGYAVPIVETQTQDCVNCHGKGFLRESDKTIQTNAEDVAKKMINLDLKDKKTQETLKTTYAKLTQSIVGDKPTWDYFMADAKATMAVPEPSPGTLVIAEVWIDDARKDGKGRRVYQAEIAGTTNKFTVINPPAADNVNDGFALMGGVIAPASEKASPDAPTTIQGAFIIAPALDDKWTWWERHHKG